MLYRPNETEWMNEWQNLYSVLKITEYVFSLLWNWFIDINDFGAMLLLITLIQLTRRNVIHTRNALVQFDVTVSVVGVTDIATMSAGCGVTMRQCDTVVSRDWHLCDSCLLTSCLAAAIRHSFPLTADSSSPASPTCKNFISPWCGSKHTEREYTTDTKLR